MSWKQSMNMGIIAALKKRYKYFMMRDILGFHNLSPTMQNKPRQQGTTIRRGAAGVCNAKSTTMVDAAKYIKEAWDSTTVTTMINSFSKRTL